MPVVIDGLRETYRMLREVSDEGPRALRTGLAKGAQNIVPAIAGAYPYVDGDLSGAVRVTRGQFPAIRVDPPEPYAGPVDFGGYPGNRPFVGDGRYLYPTVAREEDRIVEDAVDAVDAVIRRA